MNFWGLFNSVFIYSLVVICKCDGMNLSNVYFMNLLSSYLFSVIRYLLACSHLTQHGLCKYFVVRVIYPKVFVTLVIIFLFELILH